MTRTPNGTGARFPRALSGLVAPRRRTPHTGPALEVRPPGLVGRSADPDLASVTWAKRLAELARALGRTATPRDRITEDQLGGALLETITATDREEVWLALSVMTAVFPEDTRVMEVARESEFDGGAALAAAVAAATDEHTVRWGVRVVCAQTLVDVHHTLTFPYTSGIQRVVRETVTRWRRDHGCRPIGWTPNFLSIRALGPDEDAALEVPPREQTGPGFERDYDVLVPWESTYLLAELAAEPYRTARLRAQAQWSRCLTGVIGYDCVPITSAETIAAGTETFARNLSAVAHFDRVTTISEAAGSEYRGWIRALGAIGLSGPQVRPVLLPVEVPEQVSAQAMDQARDRFVVNDLPLILVVGSHEPRKNHDAVLHAAELLWREGLAFSLTFVGSGGWRSERFTQQLEQLQAHGRPVDLAKGIGDEVLFAAYRLARFTVFPSLNEGFGLPAAESLACGTPVVTSDFGSMLEIAADGGALTVDPRDDHAIADAMRGLLTDDDLLHRLQEQARRRPRRTWDDYAAETWESLTGGAN